MTGAPAAARLRVGLAQLAEEVALAANADKIVAFVDRAAAAGCDLVVFPEGALGGPADTPRAAIDAALERIRRAAAADRVNLVLGLVQRRAPDEPLHNRLVVIDRRGAIVHAYDKLWNDARFDLVPRSFPIDGVPCAAAICADRWIRAVEDLPVVEGARVLIEISSNYADEWIADLDWYWQVPRALRNGAFVLVCNSAAAGPGRIARGHGPGHGHSAVIDPAGRIVAAAGEEADTLLLAELELGRATGAEAARRHHHPLLRPFWDVGAILLRGGRVEVEPFAPPMSAETEIGLAAAQIACGRSVADNVATIVAAIEAAAAAGVDCVALPALALTGPIAEDVARLTADGLEAALAAIGAATRRCGLVAVVGGPGPGAAGERFNSAFVLGPDGALATRYDQIAGDPRGPFAPGRSSRAMWFQVKGVPAVVTIGADACWTELAELAAMRGAQLHCHLANDPLATPAAGRLRRQLWVTLASFYTFTATVNAAGAGGSALWQDFRPTTNHRRPHGGGSRFCAIPLAEAGTAPALIHARQRLPPVNLAYEAMVATTVPRMRAWYDAGVRAIASAQEPAPGPERGERVR